MLGVRVVCVGVNVQKRACVGCWAWFGCGCVNGLGCAGGEDGW